MPCAWSSSHYALPLSKTSFSDKSIQEQTKSSTVIRTTWGRVPSDVKSARQLVVDCTLPLHSTLHLTMAGLISEPQWIDAPIARIQHLCPIRGNGIWNSMIHASPSPFGSRQANCSFQSDGLQNFIILSLASRRRSHHPRIFTSVS